MMLLIDRYLLDRVRGVVSQVKGVVVRGMVRGVVRGKGEVQGHTFNLSSSDKGFLCTPPTPPCAKDL